MAQQKRNMDVLPRIFFIFVNIFKLFQSGLKNKFEIKQ